MVLFCLIYQEPAHVKQDWHWRRITVYLVAGAHTGAFSPQSEILLGDRIQNTALDVLESLIEATYTRQRSRYLSQANLGLEKLRFLLRLAWELHYLNRRRYEHAARTIDEVGRRVGAWRKAHHAQESTQSV